jgi:SAM-dependent methyltransferase
MDHTKQSEGREAPRPTLEMFEQHWRLDQRDKTAQAEFWDRRADSFNQHKDSGDSKLHRGELMGELAERCRLGPDSLVLDIGCGSGHNTLILADLVRQVEAFDISPRMIELARQNAEKENKDGRVNFQVLDWSKSDLGLLGWERRFDLVLASRTPAICDRPSLEKMMAAAKATCLIITFADTRSELKDHLKQVMNREGQAMRAGRSFYCAFNLLWLMGYFPEISYLDHAWESELNREDAYLVHSRYFEQGGPLKDEEKVRLQRELDGLAAADGLVRERVRAKMALMRWAVTERHSD